VEAAARGAIVAPDDALFAYLHGRRRVPQGAAWDRAVAAWRTLGAAKAVRVRVRDLDGAAVDARFSLLFIGNGRYEPRGFAPVHRATLDDARLDLRVLGVSRRSHRARIIVDLLTGRISRNRRYQEFSDAEFELDLLGGPHRIARDGELGEPIDHLTARVLPRALTVIAPASARRRP